MRFDILFDALERIKNRWATEGIAIRPGNSSKALDAFEARYGVILPSSVRTYFAAVDDMVGEYCFRFWPLVEVMPIASDFGTETERMKRVASGSSSAII